MFAMNLMNMIPLFYLLVNAFIFSLAVAQFPPTLENVTVIKSRFDEGITISYKEVCSLGSAAPGSTECPSF
jgi:hypothetical protein